MDIFPSRRSISWHSIRKAFPCAGAAAAASIVNALDRLGGNHSHAPAVSSSHARDVTVNKSATRRMLPPNHPQTIRVRRIAAHLIATACECDDKSRFGFGGRRSLLERTRWCPVNGGVDWRVDVAVDDQALYAYSYSKGIVTVSTGFLKYMRTDADVAAVLGHEVAHVIARHGLKTLRNRFWVGFLVNFAAELLNVPRERFTEDKWEFILERPWHFRKEYEADHLGLLLLATAGYDPRIAPKMYEKFRRLREMMEGRHSASDDDVLWSTHPAHTERIRRLSQPKVMDEALDLYRQALRSGKGKRTQALDSWSSTFTFGLSWALFWTQEWLQGVPFWTQEWLQGVPNLWNSVRNSLSSRPPDHLTAHQVHVVPANWRCNDKGIAAGSLSVQTAILFRYGTGYASGWQLQNNHVHRADYSAYVQGNTGSPRARLLWDQPGARAPPRVQFFMWQLRHGRLWPPDRLPHRRHRHWLQGDKH